MSDISIEASPRWIRAVLEGHTVVDTRRAKLVWEIPYYPQYYVPLDDVADGLLRPVDDEDAREVARHPAPVRPAAGLGEGRVWQVGNGDGRAVTFDHPDLAGLVRFRWDAMDHWFEEDEEVFVHPRDPHKRVDSLASSRHVVVEVDGVVVADTQRPVMLFETGLPARTYIPKTDVRMDLLRPSERTSACPYKGFAEYWSVEVDGVVHDDIVWGYRTPFTEALPVAGLVAFYDERVDVTVDGVPVDRPRTPFG